MESSAQTAFEKAAEEAGKQAAMGFFERIFVAYNSFIDRFPEEYQWLVSLILGALVIYYLWQLIKHNWLWIVLAILLFPGLLPILKNIFDSLTTLLIGKNLE